MQKPPFLFLWCRSCKGLDTLHYTFSILTNCHTLLANQYVHYLHVHVQCIFFSAVIDLSSIEPENLGPLHLEQIPLCSFTEKGRPYKPKAKKNKKKWRKDEEHRAHKKGEGQDGERAGKKDGGEYRQVRTDV